MPLFSKARPFFLALTSSSPRAAPTRPPADATPALPTRPGPPPLASRSAPSYPPSDLVLSARRPCSPTRRRRSGAPCALRPSPACLQIGAILPSPDVASLRIRGVLPSPASRGTPPHFFPSWSSTAGP
ncbi:hypothetical protein PVAP13_5NG062824 [Panicum virgatum]|uniref:Uncharacterized protein n=1 Tax=Panicum virgatum TaxID=38727 RepID=A0A8T0RN34_PANVG|nr:hypothetical protein PVAP13_5NG062824 [Panicum virgatum]